jgi:predicted small secreted protein
MRRRRAVLAALAVASLLAGCGGTVAGTGTIAADAKKPSSKPSGSPSTAADPGRSSLSCKGTTIAPSGAPYCFVVPQGFTDVSSSVTIDTSIGNEKFRSAVAIADRDLVIVTVYALQANTDAIASDTLEGELKTVLGQLASQGFTFESTQAKRGTVDGARSFSYRARQSKDNLESDVYFLFRGKSEVEVNCQWKDKPAEVQKGCKAILDSFQFKSVR